MGREQANDKSDRILEGVAYWGSFYRCNPHRFVEEYLNIKLKLFQKFLIFAMMHNYFFMYIIEFKKVPSLAMLSNKYEKLYLKDKELFDDSKYTSGLFLLRNFYNWACQEKLTPFSSNMPFALTIDDIEIIILVAMSKETLPKLLPTNK